MGGVVVLKNCNFVVWLWEVFEIKLKEIILLVISFVLVNFNNIVGCKIKRYNDWRKNNGKFKSIVWNLLIMFWLLWRMIIKFLLIFNLNWF